MKRLFIAEKPSLAAAIAAQLNGSPSKSRTHIVVGDDIVTWCVGHILEQFMPEDYDERFKQWRSETLPIYPDIWKLKVKNGMEGQVKAIDELLKKTDIVINAGDPDREGQLLVDEVLHYLGNRKPVKRVLVSDYNEGPVRKALANIKDNSEFQGWYESALARSQFDWLFGLNLTRAFTIAGQRIGFEGVLSVGRVQTPTLRLVVERDLIIENFKPIPFFTLTGNFAHGNGNFSANWKAKKEQEGLDEEGRLVNPAIAESISKRLSGKAGKIASYEKKPGKENPPLLFSLSSLQMAANDKYGFSAQKVLDICQALYETHKLTTYPRTDCNYVSEVQHADASQIIAVISANLPALSGKTANANPQLKSAAFNDNKVTAHHAIVPTSRKIQDAKISDEEMKIYDMVARAYLSQFFPPCQFSNTSIIVSVDNEHFAVTGKTPISKGWKEVFELDETDKTTSDDESKTELPVMKTGDPVLCHTCTVNSRKTTPPARFTEKLLLAAMVDIHKYVDNPAAKARLKEGQGIGTEATRAGIIEELKKRNFIAPMKAGSKQLMSTPAGRALIIALPENAKSLAMTGICEQALDLVYAGRLSRKDFIERNMQLITKLVNDASTVTLNVPVPEKIVCPKCKSGQLKKRKGKNGFFWGCTNWNTDPKCDAIYDDSRGKPSLNPQAKKTSKPNAAKWKKN